MKPSKLFSILLVLMASAFMLATAFTPPPVDKYPYGNRQAVALTSADTVEVLPNNLTLTYATMSMDTTVVVNVDVTNSIVGDRIVFDLTADASNRDIVFNTNITGITETITASKNELLEFIYNGTVFKEVAEMAVD